MYTEKLILDLLEFNIQVQIDTTTKLSKYRRQQTPLPCHIFIEKYRRKLMESLDKNNIHIFVFLIHL